MKRITDEQRLLKDLFDMLEAHMGSETELVLYDLDDKSESAGNSIADIRNEQIFGRAVERGLEVEKLAGFEGLKDTFNEFVHTDSGKILRCSNAFLYDDEGKVIGGIGINQDITRAIDAERFLRDFNMYRICDGGIFSTDISSVLDDFIQEALADVGKTFEEMKREDKIRFVRFLDAKGVFLVMKSGTKICNLLDISKYTLYNYLGRNSGGEE